MKRASFFFMALLCASGAGHAFVTEQPWLFSFYALGCLIWTEDFVAGKVVPIPTRKVFTRKANDETP
jgi:hypothetical protein